MRLTGGEGQKKRSSISCPRGSEEMTSTSCDNVFKTDMHVGGVDNCKHSNGGKMKKKAPRTSGWGLRRYSKIVCKKVETKRRTTYNEVADEIVADLSLAKHHAQVEGAGSDLDQACSESEQLPEQFDEKNVRRRVYDAFNVLISINVIAKNNKEIRWMGFPTTRTEEVDELKKRHMSVLNRIQEKADYLKELEDKFLNLQNLILRNQRVSNSEKSNVPPDSIGLPFMLAQTTREAEVEIEISEDMQLVHFDFNGTPFKLHDDAAILKKMISSGQAEVKDVVRGSSEGSSLITGPDGNLLKPVSFSWDFEKII